MTQLDEFTRTRVNSILALAARSGHDKAEALYRAQLLWTPRREREIKADSLRFILQEMQTWRPAEFMRSINRNLTSGTPADMHRAIAEWVGKHISALERDQ